MNGFTPLDEQWLDKQWLRKAQELEGDLEAVQTEMRDQQKRRELTDQREVLLCWTCQHINTACTLQRLKTRARELRIKLQTNQDKIILNQIEQDMANLVQQVRVQHFAESHASAYFLIYCQNVGLCWGLLSETDSRM